MRLYKTIAYSPTREEVVWAGSQADAAKVRKVFVSTGFKRADVVTEEVDVPTNKAGLLEFLNARD